MQSTIVRVAGTPARWVGVLILALMGCGEGPSGSGGTGGTSSGGAGGTGGDTTTTTSETTTSTTTDCLASQCPAPEDPDCASAYCKDNACALFYAAPTTACGFAGHCDGAGHCTGLVKPIKCDVPCDDGNPCTVDSCNGHTGMCEHTNLDNNTTCDNGAGHCNSFDGTCCDALEAFVCPNDPDPVTCFLGCLGKPCQINCVQACPFGLTADPKSNAPYVCQPPIP